VVGLAIEGANRHNMKLVGQTRENLALHHFARAIFTRTNPSLDRLEVGTRFANCPEQQKAEEVATFGSQVPMKRPGQPFEVATYFVFLASSDSSYIAGQTLHPNGGEVVGA